MLTRLDHPPRLALESEEPDCWQLFELSVARGDGEEIQCEGEERVVEMLVSDEEACVHLD